MPEEEASADLSTGAYLVLGLLGICVLLVFFRSIASFFRRASAGPTVSQPKPRKAKKLPDKLRPPPPLPQEEEPAQAKAPGISLKSLQKRAQAAQKTKGHGPDDHDKGSQHPLFLGSFKGHRDNIAALAWSRDGAYLATACDDQSIRMFAAVDKGNPLRVRNFNLVPSCVAFGQGSNQLLAVLQSYVDGAVLTSVVPNQHKSGPAASFDTEWELPKLHGGKEHAKQMLSAQGIVVVLSETSQMRLVSLTGQPLTIIETAGLTNHGAALSHDGRFLAAATFAADIKVHEIRYNRQGGFESVSKVMDLKGHKRQAAGGPKRLLQQPQEVPSSQCYSHLAYGARHVLAAVYGSTLHFLNAESGQLLESIPDAHDQAITALQWAPQQSDDKAPWSLATASKDRKLRLWRMPEP
ncbi:hypothetical protein WJX84_008844 [Apatococcus fuscideae]|uniref:Uncharacterized protein n=1 Tax=Apatococcus fuscideae TaxID=2026836 RepID=A0AAW1SJX0_9CHLO